MNPSLAIVIGQSFNIHQLCTGQPNHSERKMEYHPLDLTLDDLKNGLFSHIHFMN